MKERDYVTGMNDCILIAGIKGRKFESGLKDSLIMKG